MSEDLRKHLPTVLVGIVALVVGYFAGREHVKYEIRSTFAEAAEAVLGAGNPLLSFLAAPGEDPGEVVEGEMVAEINGVRIEVTDASIGHPKVREAFSRRSGFKPTKDPHLVLTLAITNQDPRKILRFLDYPINPGIALYDDVDNILAPSLLGFMSEFQGALSPTDDIDPGETVSHLIAYRVPPEATEI